MKKIISSLIAIAILTSAVSLNVFAQKGSNRFSDITGSEYYAESADVLSELNIISGYTDGSFGPGKEITRAEMAAIICRVIDKENEASVSKSYTVFDDVDNSHWAVGYINIASDEGIVNGDGNGKFRPEDNVTYEEAIKMIVCAMKLDYNIKVDPKDWSAGYIQVAQKKGITNKARGSKGKPSSRGDVAVMIHGAIVSDLVSPEASLESGDYVGEQKVRLTTETEGADIYYTTDGRDPSINGKKYKNALTISDTCTLKAIAVKKGILVSDIMSERYYIYPETYMLTVEENRHGDIIVSEGEYEENSSIYIRAIPDDGYEFERWYSDNGGSFSNKRSSDCTFTMPGNDVVISAEFSKIVVEEEKVEVETSTNNNTSSETNNNEENQESSDVNETTDTTPTGNNVVSYAPGYYNSAVPQYDYVTGAKVSVNFHGEEVAPLIFRQSNAIIIRYFYDSNAEQVETYKNYLLATGWTLNGTSTGGDSRGQCEKIGYSHKDSNGNTDAQVEIDFFPGCGDVDLVCVLKSND